MHNHLYFKNLHLLICVVSHFQEHKNYNGNYNKILESDRSSAALITALIGQLHTSCTLCTPCLSYWTVCVIKRMLVAPEWVICYSI